MNFICSVQVSAIVICCRRARLSSASLALARPSKLSFLLEIFTILVSQVAVCQRIKLTLLPGEINKDDRRFNSVNAP